MMDWLAYALGWSLVALVLWALLDFDGLAHSLWRLDRMARRFLHDQEIDR